MGFHIPSDSRHRQWQVLTHAVVAELIFGAIKMVVIITDLKVLRVSTNAFVFRAELTIIAICWTAAAWIHPDLAHTIQAYFLFVAVVISQARVAFGLLTPMDPRHADTVHADLA